METKPKPIPNPPPRSGGRTPKPPHLSKPLPPPPPPESKTAMPLSRAGEQKTEANALRRRRNDVAQLVLNFDDTNASDPGDDNSAIASRIVPSTSIATSHADPPARHLAGKALGNGWIVEKPIERSVDGTGGHFSCSYIVRSKTGKLAFLKAMDYTRALDMDDPAWHLKIMTEAFVAERDLLDKCQSKRLSRVVRMLDSGKLSPPRNNPAGVVQYIIFELASGDIRHASQSSDPFDVAWALRAMHHATVALKQLHSIGIAHQDIKPSNVLTFKDNQVKIADLGSACERGIASRFDNTRFPGDLTYAPPELLYDELSPDWRTRRFASDMYLLGSTVLFLLTKMSMTPALFHRLAPEHRRERWPGTYREVLPFIQHAFSGVMEDVSRMNFFGINEVATSIAQLCNPIPELRGHPKDRHRHRYSLERYIAQFDLLARKAEFAFARENAT